MKLPPGYVAGVGVRKATAEGGFGERMLQQMGWQKGRGLGKNMDGMERPIEVKQKDDNAGVRSSLPR
jgi:G-patch domain